MNIIFYRKVGGGIMTGSSPLLPPGTSTQVCSHLHNLKIYCFAISGTDSLIFISFWQKLLSTYSEVCFFVIRHRVTLGTLKPMVRVQSFKSPEISQISRFITWRFVKNRHTLHRSNSQFFVLLHLHKGNPIWKNRMDLSYLVSWFSSSGVYFIYTNT